MCFITAVQRFGKSCIPVVDRSDYLGHLIRHLLNASEAFPHRVVSSIFGTSQSLVGSFQDCMAGLEALAIHTFPKFPILHLRLKPCFVVQNEDTGCEHGRPFLANLWTQNILQKLSVVCRCYSGPRRHSVCCYH